jgi:hypothetical protein
MHKTVTIPYIDTPSLKDLTCVLRILSISYLIIVECLLFFPSIHIHKYKIVHQREENKFAVEKYKFNLSHLIA